MSGILKKEGHLTMLPTALQECFRTLVDNAQTADAELRWPEASWQALRRAGVLGWIIDAGEGGSSLDAIALLEGYEQIASSCLTTCFVLSQRESAIRHIKKMRDPDLRHELLFRLANGETFATVGLSQLTTSRQHQGPVLVARLDNGRLHLDGVIPWVTGAGKADYIVIGAVTDRNMQFLAALPTSTPGVHVQAPLELMALRGSLTAEVRLDNVFLDERWILAGPAEKIMAAGKGGAGGLETSCLALGLAGAAIGYIGQEAKVRSDLRESADNLEQEQGKMRQDLHELAQKGADAMTAAALRARANSLVLRSCQVALTAAKGAGFLLSHPAQRWARQGMFFLVWSCPRPTTEATLAHLAPGPRTECFF